VLAPAAATPGLWDWSFNPPLLLILGLGLLYWIGDRRTVTPKRTRPAQRRRSACFYAALTILLIALCSPLDALSEQLFWAHMVQHVLLMLVAAPMIVVAKPWIRLWRSLGLDSRQRLGRSLGLGRRAGPLRRLSGFLGTPTVSFVAFSVVLLGWHVPAMFEATLRSEALHALEHSLFFATSILFWKQVIPSAPLRIVLDDARRVLFAIGAMIVSWVLAVVLALAPHPLYASYAHLASRPGGISAMADQQLAAGIMWVPGSVTFLIVVFVYVHRWLMPRSAASSRSPGLAGEH
jgi:putative membrane protein